MTVLLLLIQLLLPTLTWLPLQLLILLLHPHIHTADDVPHIGVIAPFVVEVWLCTHPLVLLEGMLTNKTGHLYFLSEIKDQIVIKCKIEKISKCKFNMTSS